MKLSDAAKIVKPFKTVNTKIDPIQTISSDWEYELKGRSAKPIRVFSKSLGLDFTYQINLNDLLSSFIFEDKLTMMHGKISVKGDSRIGFTSNGFMQGEEIEKAVDFISMSEVTPLKSKDFDEGYIYRGSDKSLYYYIGKTDVMSFAHLSQYSRVISPKLSIKKNLNESHIFRKIEIIGTNKFKFIGNIVKSSKAIFMVSQELKLTKSLDSRMLKILSTFNFHKLGGWIGETYSVIFPSLKRNSKLINLKDFKKEDLAILKENISFYPVLKIEDKYYYPALQKLRPISDAYSDAYIDEAYYKGDEGTEFIIEINGVYFTFKNNFIEIKNENIFHKSFYQNMKFINKINEVEVFKSFENQKYGKIERVLTYNNLKNVEMFYISI